MKKFVGISDIHLLSKKPIARTDDILMMQWSKFDFLVEYCLQNDIYSIFHAGDLTEDAVGWSVFYQLSQRLHTLKSNGIKFFTIYGQHDLIARTRKNTTLELLSRLGLVQILNQDPINIVDQGFCSRFYGCSYGEEVPKIYDIEGVQSKHFLIIHDSISDVELWPGSGRKPSKLFLRQNPFDFILCGDIHREFTTYDGGRVIINTGPMIRAEATEYNFSHKPKFIIFNQTGNILDQVVIQHHPSTEVISCEHIRKEADRQERKERMKAEFSKAMLEKTTFTFKQNLSSFIRDNAVEEEVVHEIETAREENTMGGK